MKKILYCMLMIIIVITSAACSANKDTVSPLNPDKPITITIWSYYNGSIKETFDGLITLFNETKGMELGIIVEEKSYGEVYLLENALLEAANNSIGSSPMPNIFATYADNAYNLAGYNLLIPFNKYFSDEELAEYRTEFLNEGRFLAGDDLYILPIAKSTENLFINQTDWEPFAKEYGYMNEDLATWNGLYNISKKYYEVTGRSFLSIDSAANFMILFSKQLGEDILTLDSHGEPSFNLTETVAKKVWAYFYEPYINGYYSKKGRFSSDSAKTGDVIAFIGSTAGAGYFPSEVTYDDQTIYAIEPLVLAYPYYEEKRKFAVQQGAGMSITKAEEAYEYASSEFLKWFTAVDNNLDFAIDSGYLPVKNQAYDENLLVHTLDRTHQSTQAIEASLVTTIDMFKNYELYSSQSYYGSLELRNQLNDHLFNKIVMDLNILDAGIAEGGNREEMIAEMTSDTEFSNWYNNIIEEAGKILN